MGLGPVREAIEHLEHNYSIGTDLEPNVRMLINQIYDLTKSNWRKVLCPDYDSRR